MVDKRPFARLRPFMKQSRSDIATALQAVAETLADCEEECTLQIRSFDDKREHCFVLEIRKESVSLGTEPIKRPDLELIARSDIFDSILLGSESPLEVFLRGRMRVRGNLEMAERLMRHLASNTRRSVQDLQLRSRRNGLC